MILLKRCFADKRIVGLAGLKDSGKTNNLVFLINQFRENNKSVPIYVYGMPETVMEHLSKLGVKEISSINHLIGKRDCLLILDEFQQLKISDRRYKDKLDQFVDYVYHNNVWCILSSPNIREFNSVIGGVIERWMLKDVRADMCINGSQLKKVVEEYNGRHKCLNSITVPRDKILVIDEKEEVLIECKYVEKVDTKKSNTDIFCQEKVKKLSKKKSGGKCQ